MSVFQFRCRAKTESCQFRVVAVRQGRASCDCEGFNGAICSHIDATLIAGERAMVPQEDWTIADQAMNGLGDCIIVPLDWKGSWRRNLAWRGLAPARTVVNRTGLTGKPIVCFTGKMPKQRAVIFKDAVAGGWETVDHPHTKTKVLVAADVHADSGKLKFARKHGIPILSFDEWEVLTADGELSKEMSQ